MGLFSFSNICTVLSFVYIAHTIWSLSIFWRTESCEFSKNDPNCFKPLANKIYKLEIRASHRSVSFPVANKELPKILDKTFDHEESWNEDVTFDLHENSINNGSLYFYVKIWPVLPTIKDSKETTFYYKHQVSDHRIPTRLQNLFDKTENEEDKKYLSDGLKPATHISSSFALSGPTNLPNLNLQTWPNELRNVKMVRGMEKTFIPPIEVDMMNIRYEHGREVLASNTTTTINVVYSAKSTGTFRFMKTMAASFNNMKEQFGFQDKDIDELKSLLADTSIQMLLLTFFVSVFHLLVEGV